MCGISGFINYKNDALIRKMTRVIKHRGPDDEGIYITSNVSLGNRRLSIIDLSKKGHQPMLSDNKTIALTYNGEVFNFLELRQELILLNHKFKSRTDTEVIIHAYEQWGIETVKKFRGFFSFALWDKKRKTLFLVRDRIGVKPLYYHVQGNKLFFASEIKSLLENENIKRQVNETAFNQYLAWQTSLTDQTMFQSIKKVPPSSIIIFKNGKLIFRKYWQLKKQKKINLLSSTEIEEEFKNLLLESIKLRLISDVNSGILLSGGLDSSTLVALASRISSKKIQTFSVGFGQKDDELSYARLVADKFKTNHHELVIYPENIQKILSKIVWHQDEPLADGGGIATYLVMQQIRKSVKVVLVGEGADELLGGYNWHKLDLPIFRLLPLEIRKKIYFYLTTFNRKNDKNKQYRSLNKYRGDFLTKMTGFEIENILPNSLLMKVDKMSSAWGIEAREPFLDHKLVEFCFSLDRKEKINLRQNKILLRKTMVILPEEIRRRKKHGFLLPVKVWLDGSLHSFAKEFLLEKSSFIRKRYGEEYIKNLFISKHFLEEFERVNLLWRLLIFELWYKAYFKD